jgi:hypothetical protein
MFPSPSPRFNLAPSPFSSRRSRLAGGIAHDFNNLLAVIASYGELVFQELSDGEPRRPDLAINPAVAEIRRGRLYAELGVRSLHEALRIASAAGLRPTA